MRVEVPRAYAWMIEAVARKGERISTAISQGFQIAAAALDRDVLYSVEREGPFADAIYDFAARVEVVASDAFDGRLSARVAGARHRTPQDGAEHALTIEHPPGDPATPLAFADLQKKSPAFTATLHELCRRAAVNDPVARSSRHWKPSSPRAQVRPILLRGDRSDRGRRRPAI